MALVNALDKSTPYHVGENGHIEHGWSADYQEKLSQFFFQLVRTKDTTELERQLNAMLKKFSNTKEPEYKMSNLYLMTTLYKLIGQTRDIVAGKGEYNLTYMQIFTWYNYYPELAKFAFKKCVMFGGATDSDEIQHSSFSEHPYGSWKDVKYFCDYVYRRTHDETHELIQYASALLVNQIKYDYKNYCLNLSGSSEDEIHVSLAAKWCPREKSKFKWLYSKLARMCFSQYFTTITDTDTPEYHAATRKAKMQFRKTIATLNKHLKTTQIAQCGKQWRTIDFNNVTSITMRKNKTAFQNKDKQGKVRYEEDEDRIACATRFEEHVERARQQMLKKTMDATENAIVGEEEDDEPEAKVHGKRVSVYELVKDAINAQQFRDETAKTVVNLQWEDNKSQNCSLGNFIPMADTSGSMTVDDSIPLYNSIGLSIRVSELTNEAFRNRILTFSSTPEWVSLDDTSTFVEKVDHVRRANWGMNTNFYLALKMVLDVIVQNELPPIDVENLVLAVFSDMQIDESSSDNMDTMYDTITKMYAEAGMRTKYGAPYKPPHILFWNLRNTKGFPVLSSQKNVTMLSGYSSVLLNTFYEKGMDGLKNYTPYKMICDILNNERYMCLETRIMDEMFKV